MINLRGSRFTDIMPENLASQLETQAFAYALGRQVEKLCGYADGIRVYAAVDIMPEKILDVLAVELRTTAYNQGFSIEAKRALVAGTIPFYARLGTPAAVEKVIRSIFKAGKVLEWFEYGGEPHHFKIDIDLQGEDVAPGTTTELRRMIDNIKRLSSWLDEIRFFLTPAKSWAVAGGAFVGSRSEDHVTITPPRLDRPGGRELARAYGVLGGMRRQIPVAVRVGDAVRAPMRTGGTGCSCGVFHAYQRVGVVVRTPAGIFSKGV